MTKRVNNRGKKSPPKKAKKSLKASQKSKVLKVEGLKDATLPAYPHPKYRGPMLDSLNGGGLLERPKFPGRTPKLCQLNRGQMGRVLLLIEQGVTDAVAAMVLGIAPETFSRWMSRGQLEQRGRFYQFYLDVTHARAKAISLAEIEVKATDAKFWLTHGPGKQLTQETPGWDQQTTINVQGGLQNQTTHLGESLVGNQAAPSEQEIAAKAFVVLENLGIIARTSRGEELFNSRKTIDVETADEIDVEVIETVNGKPTTNGKSHK